MIRSFFPHSLKPKDKEEWLLQMQRTDGAFHHKLTKARFASFIMPQEDREKEFSAILIMPLGFLFSGCAQTFGGLRNLFLPCHFQRYPQSAFKRCPIQQKRPGGRGCFESTDPDTFESTAPFQSGDSSDYRQNSTAGQKTDGGTGN